MAVLSEGVGNGRCWAVTVLASDPESAQRLAVEHLHEST
jgi:hypothetical protein